MWDDTTTISGNDTAGYHTTGYGSGSGSSTISGGFVLIADSPGGLAGLPEDGISGDLLNEVLHEQSATDQLDAFYESGSLYLYDSSVGTDYPYEVPTSAPAFLSGSTTGLADAPLAALITGSGSNSAFGFIPSTNGMTAQGLPAEKATAQHNLAQNAGPDDGVSHTSTVQPTSVLVTLAAGGRNPTDILIPSQAGTEGSGGDDDDDDVAGSGTFEAVADGGGANGKSHEESTSAVGAFCYEFFVVQGGNALARLGQGLSEAGEGIGYLCTSSQARQAAGQAFPKEWQQIKQAVRSYEANLADTIACQAERRGGMDNLSDADLFRFGLETMIGGRAVNAAVGVDEKGNVVHENLMDLGPRAQAFFFGIADTANAGAIGLGAVSGLTGLEFKLGSSLTRAEAELLAAIPKDGQRATLMRGFLEEAEGVAPRAAASALVPTAERAAAAVAPNLESFRNATLRGGFSIESISASEGELGSAGTSLGQTTIEPIGSGRMTIKIAPGQSELEQSVSIYHELLEATALDAKMPPAMLLDLSEEEFDLLAYMAQKQFGPATVENLNKLLEAVGF